jgi:hypothetical protein
VDLKLDHPTTDPKYPSFRHPTLRELDEDLKRAYDCWICLRGVKGDYLPQEEREPPEAYKARLGRAKFAPFFPESIKAYAGVLSRFELKNPPPLLEAAQSSVDEKGNSLKAWWIEVDALMLRDGAAPLQVEMPPNDAVSSGQETASGVKPYLVKRERSKMVNWRVDPEDGLLEWVIFLEAEQEPDDDFGVKIEPRYRMIGRGFQRVYRLVQEQNGEFRLETGDDIPILAAGGKPLPYVPVIWYASDDADFGAGELPLRQVVEHSIDHFQQKSDLREKDHRCNLVVPVVKGRLQPAPGMPQAELALGPNSVVELEENGSFDFKEPNATSMAETRAQLAETEKLIARQTLGFLYGDPGATKTATQAGMEGAQIQSAITRIAERKNSAMQSLMAIWCDFTGEDLDPEAGLAMNPSIFERPMEAADVAQLQSLAGGVELISQRSGVEMLIRAGKNRAVSSVDEELERLAAEVPPPPEDVGINDLGGLPPVEPMEVPEDDAPDDDELET